MASHHSTFVFTTELSSQFDLDSLDTGNSNLGYDGEHIMYHIDWRGSERGLTKGPKRSVKCLLGMVGCGDFAQSLN